jgi:hypothetical protein
MRAAVNKVCPNDDAPANATAGVSVSARSRTGMALIVRCVDGSEHEVDVAFRQR